MSVTDEIIATPEDADWPFEPVAPTVYPPTIVANVHILANTPVFEYSGRTYPSLTIFEGRGMAHNARIDLTFTGTDAERAAAAASLHEIADRIAAWTPAESDAIKAADEPAPEPAEVLA